MAATALAELPWIGSLLSQVLVWLGVAAGLTFVIFVHELGHFLVAKACGVKCEKFYIGFDFFEIPIPFTPWKIPRALVKFQWGETEYGIGSLPLGGYVKMLGQDDDPTKAEAEAQRTRLVQAGPDGTTQVTLDPRSYPAKSVPQRMAIISAGVVMNLIFAVFLAAAAYRLGVKEIPAVAGYVAPGSPAWQVGLVPGSKILQVGSGGRPYEHLRFEDITTALALSGFHREIALLVRQPDGQEVWYHVQPSDRLKALTKRPTLGVTSAPSRDLRLRKPPADYLDPTTTPPLQDRDRVVQIAGQPVEADWEVAALLAQHPRDELKLVVERPAGAQPPQRIEVVVPPRRMRWVGTVMEMGPVVAVRKGSPAEAAGIAVGDRIVAVDDQPVGDPFSLPQRLLPQGPERTVRLTVLRKDRQGVEQPRTFTMQPQMPLQFHVDFGTGGPVAIESLGIAYAVTSKVHAVAPDSPAAAAGLQPGDQVLEVEFVPQGPQARQREAAVLSSDAFRPIVLDDDLKNWAYVLTRMQFSLPDTQVKLTWLRDHQRQTAILPMAESPDWYDESRHLAFYPVIELRQAQGLGEALKLGARESYERVKEVVLVLHRLLTRRVSATNLSGPAGIIAVAGGFASQGVAKLLIFLTMLSANLAVLNFLPIPALDGGHMLFLMAEGLRGKPLDERLQMRLTIAGVICLLSLMVFATAMDVGRFVEILQEWFS
jgi:regulator of sigma E protease